MPLSPYPDQGGKIKLNARGVQLSVDSADYPRISGFLSKCRQGAQTRSRVHRAPAASVSASRLEAKRRTPTMSLLPSAIAGTGLIGGFAAARATKNRKLGGAVLAAAGTGAFLLWKANAGTPRAAALTGLYLAAFGASHPLAKKIGAWPAVNAVTAAVVLASLVAGHRK